MPKQRARRRGGFSSDYLSADLDIFTLLHALHVHGQSGVRDYLVHRLYDMSDADIDFTLPQLLSLLLSWDAGTSYRLCEFLIAKCSQSIHLSLKVLWILQAAEYYSKREDERLRVRELIHSCEMSLVNASIFGEGEHAADGQGGSNRSAARVKEEKHRLHIRNSNYYAEQQERRRLASPTSASASRPPSSGADGEAFSPPVSPERPFIFGTATNAYSARIFSPPRASAVDAIAATTFSFNASSIPAPAPPVSASSIPVSVEEVYFALSKKVKCEYFNLELQLIHQLMLISSHLVRFPAAKRKAKLRRMLASLPAQYTASLYFPSNIPNAEHYRILRLLPAECISLSSHDKAPYLLYAEVEYTGSSVYAYDIYTAYKSNDEIMEESIQLCEEGQQLQRQGSEDGEDEDGQERKDGQDGIVMLEPGEQNGEAATGTEEQQQPPPPVTGKSAEEKAFRPPPLQTNNLGGSGAKSAGSKSKSKLSASPPQPTQPSPPPPPAAAAAAAAAPGNAAVQPHPHAATTLPNHPARADAHDGHGHTAAHPHPHAHTHAAGAGSRPRGSLSHPLVAGQDPVEQINAQTAAAQQVTLQQVFQDMDAEQVRRKSVAGVISSLIKPIDAHPASALAAVASSQQQEEKEDQREQQTPSQPRAQQTPHEPRVIRIRDMQPQQPQSSALSNSSGPLFRVSSASQPDSPRDDSALMMGTSAPRAGHADTLTGLMERAEEDGKRELDDEADGASLDLSVLTEQTASSGAASLSTTSASTPSSTRSLSITVSPVTSSTASPLLSPVSEEGVQHVSSPGHLHAAKKISHAVSSPNLQAQTEEAAAAAAAENSSDSNQLQQPAPAAAAPHSSSKHKKAGEKAASRSAKDKKPHPLSTMASATPARPASPPPDAEPEPAYMSDPEWQQLDAAFGDRWAARKKRVWSSSPYSQLPRWDLISCIFKSGDDCRQEVLAMQLIHVFEHIWKEARLPLWLRPYSVLITSPTSGLIETLQDATSIDALKKSQLPHDPQTSLSGFFHRYFRLQGERRHVEAVRNFAESMAGYSIICYLLQIKDRHNGNIMLDRDGHVIHIDYGFMLSNSPGRNWGWESSPFKLTSEYIRVMTIDSRQSFFPYFRTLVVQGYMEARKHWHVLALLIEMMMRGQNSSLPCFAGAGETGTMLQLRQRFMVDGSDEEALQHAMQLIDKSIDNWRSVRYDSFQRMTNGIV